jgi:hypothetical protein
VNPAEGPVQALAFDLRALRESVGNPTYRALAKTAGYSATTLGEAAGGRHLPTLEVTLAYIGACGGDAAAWRRRWQEVSRLSAVERAAPAVQPEAEHEHEHGSGSGFESELAAESELSSISTGSVPAATGNRVRTFAPWIIGTAALTGLLVAVVTGAFAAQAPPARQGTAKPGSAHAASAATGAHCPAVPAAGTPVAFTGTTYGLGANVRDGASLQSPVRFRIPAGCAVGFSGYCLGDIVVDVTAGTPDMRWFIIPGVGEVASAIVHGDPPASLAAQPCPDNVPRPAAISIAIAPTGTGGGVVQLAATGSRLWIVGFAAYYPSGGANGTSRWHQFGFGDNETAGTFSSSPLHLTTASAGASAAASAATSIPVVAVACIGGDGPTTTIATGAVNPVAPQKLLPLPSQPAATLASAEQVACEYPGSAAGD